MKVTFQIEGGSPVTIECNAGDNLLELARRAVSSRLSPKLHSMMTGLPPSIWKVTFIGKVPFMTYFYRYLLSIKTGKKSIRFLIKKE